MGVLWRWESNYVPGAIGRAASPVLREWAQAASGTSPDMECTVGCQAIAAVVAAALDDPTEGLTRAVAVVAGADSAAVEGTALVREVQNYYPPIHNKEAAVILVWAQLRPEMKIKSRN